jgi:hypothetical protein
MESFLAISAYFQPPSPPPIRYLPLAHTDLGWIVRSTPLPPLHTVEIGTVGPQRTKHAKVRVVAQPYHIRQVTKPAIRRAVSCPLDTHTDTTTRLPRPTPRPKNPSQPSTSGRPSTPPRLSVPRRSPAPSSRRSVPRQQPAIPSRSSRISSEPSTATVSSVSSSKLLPVEEGESEVDQIDDDGEEEIDIRLDDEDTISHDGEPQAPMARPSGEQGRPARGGYTLREAAGLDIEEYVNMKVCPSFTL